MSNVVNPPLPPLAEYYRRCKAHDWFYEHSDTHAVWEAGHQEHQALQAIAWRSPPHNDIYQAWVDFKVYGIGGEPRQPAEAAA